MSAAALTSAQRERRHFLQRGSVTGESRAQLMLSKRASTKTAGIGAESLAAGDVRLQNLPSL